MCELEDLFTYADIEDVSETARGDVFIEAVVRKTGVRLMVIGDDLDDAADQMMRLVEDQVFLLDQICRDYHLSVDDIRALVDNESVSWGTSQYDLDFPEYEWTVERPQDGTNLVLPEDVDVPPVLLDHNILATPLTLVAAQPFLAMDSENDDLYLALRLPRPAELCE